MISSRPPPAGWPAGYVRVGDTLDALQALASDVRGRFDGPVVGITGSVGKTTTRALVAAALEASPGFARVHATSGNMNNHVGVPLTLLRMPPDTDACVLEMGMSGPGEIATLARVARPLPVALNGRPPRGPAIWRRRSAGEMFADAREGDACVVNADDAYVRAMRIPPGCRVASFGEDERAALEDERADVRVLFSADAETPSTFALTATKRSTSGGGGGAGVVGRRRRASVVVSGPLRVALTEPGAPRAIAAQPAAAALRWRDRSPRSPADQIVARPTGRMRPVPAAPSATRASRASTTRTTPTPRASRTRSRRFAPKPGRRTAAMLGTCSLGRPREYHREVVACLDHGFIVGFAGEAFKAAVEDVRAERGMRRACSSRTTRRALARGGGGGDEGGREGTRRRPRQGKPIHAHGPRRPQAHRGGGGGGGRRRGGAKEGRRGGGGVAW